MAGKGDMAAVARAAASGARASQLGRVGDSAVARRATGAIETHAWRDGRTVTVRARVRAYGRRYRIDFGTNHEGWSVERARVELDRILQQVERGTWEPPSPAPEATTQLDGDETIHVTASRWWQRRQAELAPNTRLDYKWRLDYVLRYLARAATAQLDVHRIDTFRGQLEAAGLSPRSVNMVLDLLAQVLDDAVEYGLLEANPARGKRRRLKVPKTSRTFLEPDMVIDLLDVAEEWERSLIDSPLGRLDMHSGQLVLGKKTEAGIDRTLELSAFLLDELRGHLAAMPVNLRDAHGASLPIFHTRRGGRLNPSNVRNRLLNGGVSQGKRDKEGTKGVVQRVNEKRAAEGRMLLPERVTPHTLRRTFASLCFFAGRDLRWVMGQLGHDDPRMTLAVYAQCMKRKRIDHALVWRLMRFPDEPADTKLGGRP